jgi:hypothetical protein
MDPRVERFRAKAAECQRAAQASKDTLARRTYLELTTSWNELADQVERLDRERQKP